VEDGGAASGATPNADADCVAGVPNGEEEDKGTVCFATPKDDVVCVDDRLNGEGEAGGALGPKVLADGSPNSGCPRGLNKDIVPPKEEREACGLDASTEGVTFKSCSAVLPYAEEIDDEWV
jgi:hypothetical protein